MRIPTLIQKNILAICLIAVSLDVHALVTIEIDQGIQSGVPIAVVPFGLDFDIESEFTIDEVIRSDLGRTGRFDPKSPDDFLSLPTKHEDVKFDDWRLINVDFLVIGNVTVQNGQYQVIFRLYDALEQVQVIAFKYLVRPHELRAIAHRIANTVFEKITGAKSSFHTRVAYTTAAPSERGDVDYRLFVADYDGYGAKELFRSSFPILSPTWSPDSDYLAYSVLHADKSRIYRQSLATGEREVIAEFEGQNRSPSWSPDGNKIAFAKSYEGNSEIFVLSLNSGSMTQLTQSQYIDTEPSWSPDGKDIVFTSNRGRYAQIYRIKAESGGRPERVTIGGTYNAGAQYFSSGKKLALISDLGNGNQVAIYEFSNEETAVISSTSLDDSVSVSPNGDMLMYVVEGQDRHLRVISPNGQAQFRIPVAIGSVRQVIWESRK